MSDNPLFLYYNNTLCLCIGLSNRIASGQALSEEEALCYQSMLSLQRQVCKNIEASVTPPQEPNDGEA